MSGDTSQIHKLMEEARVIGLLWSTDDVQILFPALTDDQAWEILQSIDLRADLGCSWDTLQIYGDDWVEDNCRKERNPK